MTSSGRLRQHLGVMAEVIGNHGLDEEVAVVVALVTTEVERLPDFFSERRQAFRLQLLVEEFVGLDR